MAVAKAAAEESGLPLYRYFGGSGGMQMPVPMMNVINGGAHASNNLDIQEFMIVPVGAASFREALRCGAEVFHALKSLLESKRLSTTVETKAGSHRTCRATKRGCSWCSKRSSARVTTPARTWRSRSIAPAPNSTGTANTFSTRKAKARLRGVRRIFSQDGGQVPDHQHRDGMAESDWDGWRALTERLGKKVQLVGDDVFVTNTKILREGIQLGVANSILIKVNQIGTLTETFAAIELAKRSGYTAVISHRSGETEDTTISDIAVGMNALQIKTGSLSRSDRVAKYNQLRVSRKILGTRSATRGGKPSIS